MLRCARKLVRAGFRDLLQWKRGAIKPYFDDWNLFGKLGITIRNPKSLSTVCPGRIRGLSALGRAKPMLSDINLLINPNSVGKC